MNESGNDRVIIDIFASALNQNIELTKKLVAYASASDEILKKLLKRISTNRKCLKLICAISIAGGYYQHKKNQSLEKRLNLLEGKDRGE